MAQQAISSTYSRAAAPTPGDPYPGPGCAVGGYLLSKLLGKGAMGEVYRARDQRLDRDVAIKFVSPERAADAGAAERLAHEARVSSALTHPGIVTVHHIGAWQGLPFIVMELVEGESLAARLARGPLKIYDALCLAAEIAEALAAAHEAGVVHRDLKPQNIMLTTEGRVKIVDFGLGMLQRGLRRDVSAYASTESMRLPLQGTIGYMSPEQAAGVPPDLRTDQFALGAILYEMVSGHRAFARPTDVQTLADIIDAEAVPLETRCPMAPRALVAIVNRCLQKEPRHRYGSTGDLAYDLKAAAEAAAPSRRVWRLALHRTRHLMRLWCLALLRG